MPSSFVVKPIGLIRTPYTDKYAAPSQPALSEVEVVGTIELYAHQNFEQALADLEGFELIWIVSWFDRLHGWSPKVLPPRGGRLKRGMFATRSPHRPNPIGLTLCRMLDVRGRRIRVANPDLLDGTPILDLKPYVPYSEAFPHAKGGWIDSIPKTGDCGFTITTSPLALEQLEWLEERGVLLHEWTARILSVDPLPHPYKRTTAHSNGGYVFARKSWRVRYEIERKTVILTAIESGYKPVKLRSMPATGEEGKDRKLHMSFLKVWPAASSQVAPRDDLDLA